MGDRTRVMSLLDAMWLVLVVLLRAGRRLASPAWCAALRGGLEHIEQDELLRARARRSV